MMRADMSVPLRESSNLLFANVSCAWVVLRIVGVRHVRLEGSNTTARGRAGFVVCASAGAIRPVVVAVLGGLRGTERPQQHLLLRLIRSCLHRPCVAIGSQAARLHGGSLRQRGEGKRGRAWKELSDGASMIIIWVTEEGRFMGRRDTCCWGGIQECTELCRCREFDSRLCGRGSRVRGRRFEVFFCDVLFGQLSLCRAGGHMPMHRCATLENQPRQQRRMALDKIPEQCNGFTRPLFLAGDLVKCVFFCLVLACVRKVNYGHGLGSSHRWMMHGEGWQTPTGDTANAQTSRLEARRKVVGSTVLAKNCRPQEALLGPAFRR